MNNASVSKSGVGRRIRIVAVAAIASAAPLAFTSDGIQANDACAAGNVLDGSCCPLATAICGLNGQNYETYEWKKSCSKT